MIEQGVGVHCGEAGVYSETPHTIFLHWLDDLLDVLTEYGIGSALWNFRGPFGVIDSGRKDVDYQEWHGHKLDTKMLNMLNRY